MKHTFNYADHSFVIEYDPDDISSLGAVKEIVTNDEYILSQFANQKGSVLIDIGANIGVATIILAKLNPQSIIYCYEPNTAVYNLLIKNIQLNFISNVKAFNLGVSNQTNRLLNLSICDYMTGASSVADPILFRKIWHQNRISVVNSISLDEIISLHQIEEIYLLKINCEGAEYDIISNSSLFKKNIIRNMVGKFHDLIYNQTLNKSNDLLEYCRKYITGTLKISTAKLSLDDQMPIKLIPRTTNLSFHNQLKLGIKDKKNNILMLWTPRAGCTLSIKMMFYHMGLLNKNSITKEVHDYRGKFYEKYGIVTPKDLQNYFVFKTIVNPYQRAVSCYTVYSNVFPSASFYQFLQIVNEGSICKSQTLILEHIQPQYIQNEEKFIKAYIKLENGQKELDEKINRPLGLNLSIDNILPVSHHTIRENVDSNQLFGYLSRNNFATYPKYYKNFYDETIKQLVDQIYHDDIVNYGYSFDDIF